MKIKNITPLVLGTPWRNLTFLKVETDEGITGLGECYGGASRLGQLAEMKPLLIGEDPMNMERIRWKLGAPSALKLFGHVLGFAGLEFAILDIQGKALNKGVFALLGGKVRDEVQFSAYLFYRYANAAGTGEVSNVEQMVKFAKDLVSQYGFTTLKYKNGVLPPDEEIDTFIALRKAFPKIRIETVTGELTPEERRARVEAMGVRVITGDFAAEGDVLSGQQRDVARVRRRARRQPRIPQPTGRQRQPWPRLPSKGDQCPRPIATFRCRPPTTRGLQFLPGAKPGAPL
jgi:L-alanine-DL-glutamate epimerase-like enolase superfamily enzyme